jgi:Mg-chelatase subunit ChlD
MLKLIQNRRGAIIAMVAISLVAILGIGGLAIDGARAYVTRAQLSRAVDAAALAGAASLRQGQATARERMESLAAANGVDPALLNITFGVNAEGENTVLVSANRIMPTTFMRVLGQTQVDVGSVAEATVPPLDLCLVLDQSGSLGMENAWDDLQRAAKDFVDDFDESLDQMGLVSFQTRAAEHVMLSPSFKGPMTAAIDNMTSVGFTNTGEGLRLCKDQFDNGPVRDRSIRVVVFFTDGRPTAFREMLSGEDRIMSICMTPCKIYGYYDDPDNLPMDRYPTVSGCRSVSRCFGYREPEARDRSKQFGIEQADAIRSGGTYLYTIGLGNPNASDPLIIPDYNYLKLLANEDGMANPSQPQARSYFAPSAAELQSVFKTVAQDILVRLTH